MMIETRRRLAQTFAVLGLLVASACAEGPEPPDPPPAPRPLDVAAHIRIRNAGNRPIRRLVVVYKTEKIPFGDVAPGEVTKYQDVRGGVWEMVLFNHVLDGKVINPMVQDLHGGRVLPFTGNFTYDLVLEPTRSEYVRVLRIGRD